MKTTNALAVMLLLTGCAGLDDMPRGELAWQGLHAVDVLQTLNGPANDKCYRETDPITRRMIGSEPSKGKVVAWGLGMSVLHYAVSDRLRDRPLWLGAWQLLTIGNTAITVSDNLKVGIKPVGDNNHNKIDGCGSMAVPAPNPVIYPVK